MVGIWLRVFMVMKALDSPSQSPPEKGEMCWFLFEKLGSKNIGILSILTTNKGCRARKESQLGGGSGQLPSDKEMRKGGGVWGPQSLWCIYLGKIFNVIS